MAENREEKEARENKKWHGYWVLGGGALLIVNQFIGWGEGLSLKDILQLAFGVVLIGYGVYRVRKTK